MLQVVAKELWTSAGERIADGLLVIVGERIRSAGKGSPDPSLPLIVHDGVVSAGLIACRSQTGTTGELQDDTRSVLSRARALHAVDWSSVDFERALSAGITSLMIAPGSANLVGGLACVVKTAGERVSKPEAALAISLTSGALGRSTVQGFFLFGSAEEEAEARLVAAADGGPETTGRTTRGTRAPTSFPGAIRLLGELSAARVGPFARARGGELPVTIDAWDRHEVLRAIQLARARGWKGSIRGAPLAGDPEIVAALKESGLGVIVGPYSAEQTRRSLESVQLLAAAGVPVAFALDAPGHSPLDLRLSANRALAAGAPPEAVWKALTEDAALLAGVGDSTGRLAPECAADFVLWSGNPLDLTSRVAAVFVDGQRAWPRPGRH